MKSPSLKELQNRIKQSKRKALAHHSKLNLPIVTRDPQGQMIYEWANGKTAIVAQTNIESICLNT
ncbi:hypothetical protein RCC89_08760 [Cytophagaceae bacterium ABcell3]|nr:hypothetical protein RCC89_08760 [Cytophagaceae bacterium ABcell3]